MREGADSIDLATAIRRAQFIGQVQGTNDPLAAYLHALYLVPGAILLNHLPSSQVANSSAGPYIRLAGSRRPQRRTDRFDARNLLISSWLIIADEKAQAAFPLQWIPNGGSIERRLAVEKPAASVPELLKLIQAIRSQRSSSPDSERLQALYKTVRASIEAPVTFETQMQRAQSIVSRILPGMSRQDVDLIFPTQDGGISFSNVGRYYLGAEVMLDVPFSSDKSSGPFQSSNTVNGPVRLYRSPMHMD